MTQARASREASYLRSCPQGALPQDSPTVAPKNSLQILPQVGRGGVNIYPILMPRLSSAVLGQGPRAPVTRGGATPHWKMGVGAFPKLESAGFPNTLPQLGSLRVLQASGCKQLKGAGGCGVLGVP